VRYLLDDSDMRCGGPQGFHSGEQCCRSRRDAFGVLYAEGETAPKMLSIGLTCRVVGRPGRIASLEKFIAHVQSHADVWLCRRFDIAQHWYQHHLPVN
nr:allantoinase [Pseudomonadota bacterium]